MLFALSGLVRCPVEATDGHIGTIKDCLFDDTSWRVRWLVVETGVWRPGRQFLVHPSSVTGIDPASQAGLGMMRTGDALTVAVGLTQAQVAAGPDIGQDEPVTAETQARFYSHYGWEPNWGDAYFGPDALASPFAPPPHLPAAAEELETVQVMPSGGDSHLRSVVDLIGYRAHASDGDIGHVVQALAASPDWVVRYLVVDTGHWLPGRQVQLAPFAVAGIDAVERRVALNVTRAQVRASPAWDPIAMAQEITEQELHGHYGWPGYGW